MIADAPIMPGLLDDLTLEIFWNGKTLMATHNGQVSHFNDLPKAVKRKLYNIMLKDEVAMRIMEVEGVNIPEDQIWVYYRCGFGAVNMTPDVCLETDKATPEFWECACNGNCCLQGHFKRKMKAEGFLTDREVEVVRHLFREFEPGKCVAADLGITEDTLNKHKKAAFEKTGSKSLAELMVWAYKNALV